MRITMHTQREQRGFTRTPNCALPFSKRRKAMRKLVFGFTLIELLVSVAIFSIVMMIGVGALLSMVGANKKAESIKSVMNNLNAAVEEMSRTIRVGSVYHCGNTGSFTETRDCPEENGDENTFFAFLPSGSDPALPNNRTVYRFNPDTSQIERSQDSGTSWIAITAPEVTIERLRFYATGTDTQRFSGDSNQPRVLIIVQGVAGVGDALESPFSIETTVSQRLLDI